MGSNPTVKPNAPVLLFDGPCGFCDLTVRALLRMDRPGALRFAPLQGDYARRIRSRHPELAEIDSLILVEPERDGPGERVHVRSDAFLRVLGHVGGPWKLLLVFALVPRPIRDWAYDLLARYRYRLFGRLEERPLPPTDFEDRFLE